MDAQELRIGNYVYAQSGKLVVNRDSIYKVENVNMQSSRKYEPIPLTEEWLLLFGFHLDEGVGVWFGKELSPAKYFTIWQAYGDVPHKYTRNEPSDNININYVHHLQNLFFALTGEELQLK